MSKFINSGDDFINNLEPQMRMRSSDILIEKIRNKEDIVIIDLRMRSKFEKDGRIATSVNLEFKDFPKKLETVVPNKDTEIFCVCNGSIMSGMAVMYLYLRGYENAYNLGGGLSGWTKKELDMEYEKN